MDSIQKGFFDGVPSRTSFVFGAVSGAAVVMLLGYLFGGVALGGDKLSLAADRSAPVSAKTQPAIAQPTPPPVAPAGELPEVTKADHVRGDANAPITIVEYSDFECPFCQRFHPTMQQLLAEYAGQVKWVYRHFPLSFHPQAMPTALASECVAEQGGDDAFWSFADAMFENQATLGDALYESQVTQLGLNVDKFRDCVESQKYAQAILAQQASGASAGVTGTPGSFLIDTDGNAQLISGAVPYAQLQAAIAAALKG